MPTIYDLSNQSTELSEFYIKYYAWVKRGARSDRIKFYRNAGLCLNINLMGYSYFILQTMKYEMKNQFKKANLYSIYPFNKNLSNYDEESGSNLSHKNLRRITWVKSHLKEVS